MFQMDFVNGAEVNYQNEELHVVAKSVPQILIVRLIQRGEM